MNEIKLPVHVETIINALEWQGYSAYIVGGCVRDSILGREPKDWDITTEATPEIMQEVFKDYKIILTGIKHGTITVLLDGTPYEVTTFRTDGKYSDGRHPDEVGFITDITEDLRRRDFTMNAIAYSPLRGFVDPFMGRFYLNVHLIGCVEDANARFQEDSLRMMRAVRFSSQLGFLIEPKTQQAIKINASLISKVSKERIQSELNKILISDRPEGIRTLYELGLMDYIIPELSECFRCEQNNKHHIHNVGEHTIDTLKAIPNDLQLRLTMLFHDIGKPYTKTTDEDGHDHFYDHEEISCNIAFNTLTELRYDNDTVDNVSKLVLHHMDTISANKRTVKRLLNRLGKETLLNLVTIRLADREAHVDDDGEYIDWTKEQVEILNILDNIGKEKEAFSLKDLMINGNDLLRLGYKPSKELGNTLNELMEIVLENPEFNTNEELEKLAIAKLSRM